MKEEKIEKMEENIETEKEKEIDSNKGKKEKKIPKEISQEILKKIFKNLLKGIALMLYFIVLNIAYINMKQERLIEDIKIFAGTFLVMGIIMLERAYKTEKFDTTLTAIEFMCISIHSLTIMHVITMFKYDFRHYLLTSSYIFSIYYVLKSIILYTKEKRNYLKSFSDISEIVKKDEPLKKEAKKKNGDDEEDKKEVEKEKSENKKVEKIAKSQKKNKNKQNNSKTKNSKSKKSKSQKSNKSKQNKS